MMSLLIFLLNNMKSFFPSFFGFFTIFYMFEKTVGLRFGKKSSLLVWLLLWFWRYFWITLYISIFLGGKYAGQDWYERKIIFLIVLNIWVGIVMFACVFKGDLLKKLMVELVFETLLSTIYSVGIMVLFPGTTPDKVGMSMGWDPRDLLLGLWCLAFCVIFVRQNIPFIRRFMAWNPRYPFFLVLFLTAYYIMGIASNMHFALNKGNGMINLVTFCLIISLSYLWVSFLYSERMKGIRIRQELIRRESALKSHYQQALIQSAKINRYNREIDRAIRGLLEKTEFSGQEGNRLESTNQFAFGEKVDGEKKESHIKYADWDRQERLRNMAGDYLAILENHYRELSVGKYSEVVEINDLLVSCEERFLQEKIPYQIRFYDFDLPCGIRINDLEKVLMCMCDMALKHYDQTKVEGNQESGLKKEESHESGLKEEKERESDWDKEGGQGLGLKKEKDQADDCMDLIIQGGMVRQEMVLFCQYPGRLLSRKEKSKLGSLCKPFRGDVTMIEDRGLVKLIIGGA